MGTMADIDPYELVTVQECDEAIALVLEECEQIEEDLRHPHDDYTFGWLRDAKHALAIGKGLKQRLQNRRGDISAEVRHERNSRLERHFMEVCKETMTKEQFLTLVAKAEGRLTE
jgi:hypothetical protein